MEIKQLDNSRYQDAIALSLKVFTECGSDDFNAEGLETFKSFIYNDKLVNELVIFGAFENDMLVGILATKENGSHISLFFVDPTYHRKGIGRKLFEFIRINQRAKRITVNSSSYAVKFYERLGFFKTAEKQESNGMRYTPMVATE